MNTPLFLHKSIISKIAGIAVLLMGLVLMIGAAPNAVASGSAGNEFIFGFVQNVGGFGADVSVLLASESNTTVRLEYPVKNPSYTKEVSVSPGQITRVRVPLDAASRWPTNMTAGNNAVRLYSTDNKDFVVYALNLDNTSSDAALAIPTDSLGKEYYVMNGGDSWNSLYVVVATEDNTTVTIKAPFYYQDIYAPGHPVQVTLNKGEGVYGLVEHKDLTGSHITADKPVSVSSGNKCEQIPKGTQACDHLFQIEHPVSAWGKSFLAANVPQRPSGTIYKFVAATNGTEVKLDGTLMTTLNAGEFYTSSLVKGDHLIECSNPCSVSQLITGSRVTGAVSGDPSMGNLTPYAQFLASYTFATAGQLFSQNWVQIYARTKDVQAGGVQLDGAPLPVGDFTAIANTGYSVATKTLTQGTHTTASLEPHGIMVMGYNPNNSYLYPGGSNNKILTGLHWVTPVATPGGAIFPGSVQVVADWSHVDFTVTPETGRTIIGVTGCNGKLSGNTYTTGAVRGDCTVTATFAYSVTPVAGPNGVISPSSVQVLNPNETAVFTVTPDTGGSIASVTGCGGSLSGNTYTTGPVTADCTVNATFSAPPGTIVVEKQTLPDGDTTAFAFTGDLAGPITDGKVLSKLVPAGTYTTTETILGGWALTDITCDSGGVVDLGQRTATYTVKAGQTIKCTFTNTKLASLKVVKKTVDGEGTFNFTSKALPGGNFSITTANNAGEKLFNALLPGSYDLAETVPAGWDLTNAHCSDGSTLPNVVLDPGEDVTCTFENTAVGVIIVNKVTIPNGPPYSVGFGLKGPDYFRQGFSLTDINPSHNSGPLRIGEYVLTEWEHHGWELISSTCDNGDDPAKIQLDSGETVTCTFTNRQWPFAQDDSYTVPFGADLVVKNPDLLDNDVHYGGDTPTGMQVDISPSLGTVTLTGLGGFTYVQNSVANCSQDETDIFSYYNEYGSVDSDPAVVAINIHCNNQAPVAQADAYSIGEGGDLKVTAKKGLLGNDSDPDNNVVSPILVSTVTHGTLQLALDGGFLYTPTSAFSGTDSFSYKLTDGGLESSEVVVTITVNAVNNPPLPAIDSYSVAENAVLTVTAANGVLHNDLDLDGDTLLATNIPTKPVHGTLQMGLDGGFTYKPEISHNGPDNFTYMVSDGSVEVGPVAVSLTVTSVNTAPLAAADAYSLPQDGSITVHADKGVLVNDLDLDGNQLFAMIKGLTSNGPVALEFDGSFTYTPTPGFEGTDSFTYVAFDGHSESHEVTVTLNVHHTNLPPVALADKYSTARNAVLQIRSAKGLLKNDSDPDGNVLMAINVTKPQHGVVHAQKDGSFTYTPETDYAGSDSFTYEATDGSLKSSVTTVNITVNATNRAPVAVDDAYSIAQDTLLSVTASDGLLTNDTDADADQLSVHLKSSPASGILHPSLDGSFTYQPNAGFVGSDSFTYTAWDSLEESNEVTVTLNVLHVNHAPVAEDDTYSVPQDTLLKVFAKKGLLENDTDADGNPLSVQVRSNPGHGSLHLNPDGSFTYQPNAGFTGPDSFTYIATDKKKQSNVASVFIKVNASAANQPPKAVDDHYQMPGDSTLQIDVLTGVLNNDSDPDGDQISVTDAGSPLNGSIQLNLDGSFDYTPDPGYSGRDSFTYKVTDGHTASIKAATVSIDVLDHTLQVNLTGYGTVTGGAVRTVVSSIDCPGDCEGLYGEGSTARLHAAPLAGVTASWTWSGGVCADDKPSCDYTMDADKMVDVVFACKQYQLPTKVQTETAVQVEWICDDIEASKGFEIVGANAKATFKAKNSIKLGSGFKVKLGGVYHAEIVKP